MLWLPAILILPYLILLLKIYRSLKRVTNFTVPANPSIFVSVVAACRNEEKNIPSLIYDLSSQNYPKELYEVLIVNDNSTDNTFKIAAENPPEVNIKTLNNKGIGKKQALRTGIAEAKGNLIITTDADCRMGKDWMRTIAAFYEAKHPDMIICPVQLEPGSGIFRKFQDLEFLSLQGITAGSALAHNATMCNGANLAFSRQAYLLHSDNLHDEINSGDDVFLLHSLKHSESSDIAWLQSSEALVTTSSSSSLISFLRQRSRWLSKGKAYKDNYTILLGIVTFTAICLQTGYFVGTLIAPSMFWIFLSVLFLKSIPDFLILLNTTTRYSKSELMWWFLPVQLLYPLYVLSVVFYSLIPKGR
jgi:cellulose synthase/poly-beta-1,6-N-acetylglucosamine synthase-like glycosyltransferase